MNKHYKNRRKFHRISIDKRADLDFCGDAYECCQIQNLSFGGMYVSGKFSPKLEKECNVTLFLQTNSKTTSIKASATVVWGNEKGVGLKFSSMTFDNYMSLVSTLINYAEQPGIILHEYPKNCPFEINSD